MTFWKYTFPFCWSETTKWVYESTKWEYISTKWATETAKGVTETTKWESKKQQSGQRVLYHFWKYVNAKDLYQQPAKHLKVFLKFQLVTASHLWRVCVFATNQWELSKLRKATCWDWCQVGANQCGQRWSIMAASIGLTTHSQWRMDRYWTCNWVLNIPRYGMSMLDIKCPLSAILDFETPLAIYASFANPCDEHAIGFPNQSDNE